MPGLCILWQEVEMYVDDIDGVVLDIMGPHVSVVCYGSSEGWNLEGEPSLNLHLSGTTVIRSAERISISSDTSSKGNKNKSVTIILSKPFLSRLLQGEKWIEKHSLYNILLTSSGNFHQYFIELPIRHILNTLLNENIFAPLKRYYFELKLRELFFMLRLQPEISSLESHIPADIQQKLVAAKAYLLANYHKAPTIKQLSRIISLNEFKLKQFFKMQFGTTIRSYIISLRMEEAKNLLWNGHTVNDIATQLGYRNVSHFILIFKKTFGETPRQMTPKSKTHKEPPLTI
jgi:AraC-like DNA-binding protein